MKVTGHWERHMHEWTPWYPERHGNAWGEARYCAKCNLRQWRVRMETDEPLPPAA